MSTYQTGSIEVSRASQTISPFTTRGGPISAAMITASTLAGEVFCLLHVAVGGDLVVIGKDGGIIPFFGIANGQFIPVCGIAIAPSAIIKDALGNNISITTTCTGISWHGGWI